MKKNGMKPVTIPSNGAAYTKAQNQSGKAKQGKVHKGTDLRTGK